jgi:hypothetical protein
MTKLPIKTSAKLTLKNLDKRITFIEGLLYANMRAEAKLREDNLKKLWRKYNG